MADIISRCQAQRRLGICLDSAHCHAAGYHLGTFEGLQQTLAQLDRELGLQRLRLLHGNDSKSELASRVDRHWHIGRGTMGLAAFRNILCHPKLRGLPLIMETPRRSIDDDRRNMRVMTRLRRECENESSRS